MKMISREHIETINRIAEENPERASAMLEGINLIVEAKYRLINSRVYIFNQSDGRWPDALWEIDRKEAEEMSHRLENDIRIITKKKKTDTDRKEED